ncbi:lysophospholipid acyltransferase family protein [bacterium]|nr:lysophospholipid acyltransferase family protein [bacterium]MBU1065032.1 lysophospholipid acyltransferase family protein [bacterium]MBU1633440.1 lysophospholipid acyltransferase family protein [bacterium]MBU1874746.1 lysophospholipid acyltransferase family protein [bacterium]
MSLLLSIQRSTLAQAIARSVLRLTGWRIHVIPPPTSRYVLIGAPHTSNWDFFIALLFMTVEGIPVRLMGKDSLFRGPIGVFMRSLGAIPVNRRESTNLVDQVAAKFDEYDELIIGLSPEGTRKKTSCWRTGFYYIALKAEVPIVMAYLDYGNKVCGLGPSIKPTGDIQADFMIIRDFYSGIVGKYPQKQGEIELSTK